MPGTWLSLLKAFDMRRRAAARPGYRRGAADAVHTMSELRRLLPEADFVAVTCPLTKETEKLVDAEALGRMNPLPIS